MGFFSKVFKSVSKIVGKLTGAPDQDDIRKSQEEQAERARKDAVARQVQARRAEVFSQTEGSGTGTLGKIRSGLDEEIDEDEDIRIGKGSSLRI